MSPLVSVPPQDNKPLLLYILATTLVVGTLLAQHDLEGKKCAIYYISNNLIGYELN